MADLHTHISAERKLWDFRLKELWQYRDLVILFTKKTFTVSYKQTILGPAWLLLTPLLSSLVYMVVFGRIAGLSTDGIPELLFYLSGTALWGYFSSSLTTNSSTFVSNAYLFGKVYFPRLAVPISNMLVSLIRLGIQMLLVLALLVYYVAIGAVHPNWWAWLLLPLVLLHLGIMGMSFGIVLSSVTSKYRDLSALVGLGVQLWMYITPVVYPMSQLDNSFLGKLLRFNPVTMPVELFRYAVLGVGHVDGASMAFSVGITATACVLGILLFNRVEKTFMDTV